MKYIGRKKEIDQLERLTKKQTSSLVVITGRRRVGKSRLVATFAKKYPFYSFSGLAPAANTTDQTQRDAFSQQLASQTNLPNITADDWSTLFNLLAHQCSEGRSIILLDEISWMAAKDPTFLSKLKEAWDSQFSNNTKLILIVCGSVSTWIEQNILSSTAFFGRVSLKLVLEELSLTESNQLLDSLNFKQSPLEKLTALNILGGIPWYIEQLNPTLSATNNIKALCFTKNGILVDEYQRIFHDLFGRRSEIYQRISEQLCLHDLSYDEISRALNYAKSSQLTEYLDNLVTSGYVMCYQTWALKSGKQLTKIMRFRLSDNFIRFYFRYMKPKQHTIEKGRYGTAQINSLPGWDTMQGLQFESLVLKNEQMIFNALSINPMDIINSGPYFQTTTAKTKGCQIDFLIQTKTNTLYLCEIKFGRAKLKSNVIAQAQEKAKRLSLPRGFSIVPVLIHTNPLSNCLLDNDYFIHTIDIINLIEHAT